MRELGGGAIEAIGRTKKGVKGRRMGRGEGKDGGWG